MSTTTGLASSSSMLSDRRCKPAPPIGSDASNPWINWHVQTGDNPAFLPLPSKRPAFRWLSGAISETNRHRRTSRRDQRPFDGRTKMETRCERRGQVEIGIVTHDGRTYAAFGSSVNGHNVTGYTRQRNGQITLTRWDGSTMLACRSQVIREFCGWLPRPHVPPDSRAVHRRLRPGRRRDALPWRTPDRLRRRSCPPRSPRTR